MFENTISKKVENNKSVDKLEESFDQQPEDRLFHIKESINNALDRLSELKNLPKDDSQKAEIWRTLRNFTKQLREIEEEQGIEQDYSIDQE